MSDLNPELLNKLKVVELREYLSQRGLPTAGLKAELVKRLRTALVNEEQSNQKDEFPVEEEVNLQSEEEARLKADEEAKLRAEEDARLRAEEDARLRAEEEARLRAEEEARLRAEEEARLRAEEEARLRAEEEARLKAEEEARLRAEEEIRLRAEEETRLRAEEETRLRAEEEAKLRAEEEAKLRAEEEARLRAAEEARLRAEEEARLRAEEEARLRAAEEARLKAAEEARLKAAEEARLKAAEEARLKAAEEARLKAAEEARLKAAEEARLKAAEAARLKAAEEARLKAAEEARLKAAEEARLKAAEEARLKAAVEARLRAEEEEAKLRAKEEARLRAGEEAKLKAIEEAKIKEATQKLLEEEKKKKFEEEQRKRLIEEKRKKEEDELRAMNLKQAEEERHRVAEEQRIKRLAEEAEKKRIEEEEIRKQQRRIDEEEMKKEQERWLVIEQMRKAQEDHKNRIKAEEEKQKLELERKKKLEIEEQQKRLAEEEKRKAEEQQALLLEEQKKIDISTSKSSELQSNEQVSYQNIIPASISSTLPMPPFSSFQALNIMPPPPTVLMSNIPPLLPPGTSHPLTNITAAPSIFPPPPMNVVKPPVSSAITTQNHQEAESINNVGSSDIVEMDTSEIKLPQALEKVLALKTERAQQLGIDPDSVLQPISEEKSALPKTPLINLVSVDEDELLDDDEGSVKRKESKTRRRKKKKKKNKTKSKETNEMIKQSEKHSQRDSGIDVDIEYVQEVMDTTDPLYSQFMKIFEKFKLTESEKENDEASIQSLKMAAKEEMFNPMAIRKKPVDLEDDDDDEKDDDKLEEEKPKLSKRKLKKLSRMTVAELKQKVSRPELVEMHDVTAKDPVLLLHLKASRNTVPVPRHWCFKRKYLQGKRGIEKPAFELPDFIKRTGIMEMRQALQEKEDQKTMKAKMRERVRPKLGKIDIDYQKLHDAFFKWQTKPKMTIHGDLYYEGKEFETRLKEKKPGDLSEDLRTALGMPTGPNANKCPPPWLIAMQRYGPPPSYPNLKIPGLNAPIPDGCSFGYHAGGWGKPPVDETGRPLYGDVFGTQISDNQPHIPEEEIDHTLWGELESESSEEEEEDEDEEEEEEEKTEDETGLVTPAEGLITPSGFSSIPAGMETPDMIELRKRKIEAEMEGGETPALYTILPEKKTERVGAAMMGSTHIYDLAAAIPGSKLKGTTSVPPQGIEVALDPSELEMDSAAMAARYEQTIREQQSQLEKEDLSDMVAEHAARQKNKRKKQQLDSAKPPKKYKEFKF